MHLPDGNQLFTPTCGIRIKWPSERRIPPYHPFDKCNVDGIFVLKNVGDKNEKFVTNFYAISLARKKLSKNHKFSLKITFCEKRMNLKGTSCDFSLYQNLMWDLGITLNDRNSRKRRIHPILYQILKSVLCKNCISENTHTFELRRFGL